MKRTQAERSWPMLNHQSFESKYPKKAREILASKKA
jgi:hypothetical protein